jgi:hypothetical protein
MNTTPARSRLPKSIILLAIALGIVVVGASWVFPVTMLSALSGEIGFIMKSGSSYTLQRVTSHSNTLTTPNDAFTLYAFTPSRPMIELSVPANTSTMNPGIFTFPQAVVFPVKVWIVSGDSASVVRRAANAISAANATWDANKVGAHFGRVVYQDVSRNRLSPNFVNFWPNSAWLAALQTLIGCTPGYVNVYYVGGVGIPGSSPYQYSTSYGNTCGMIGSSEILAESCFPLSIVLGSQTSNQILCHEMGHLFALEHPDRLANFDATNFMWPYSATRTEFTAGQVFRINKQSNSAFRAHRNLVPGAVQMSGVEASTTDDDQPAAPGLDKRWH